MISDDLARTKWEVITDEHNRYAVRSVMTGRYVSIYGRPKHGVNLATSDSATWWEIETTNAKDIFKYANLYGLNLISFLTFISSDYAGQRKIP
jgi:hypothetical protein